MNKDGKILAWTLAICTVLQLTIAPNIAIAHAVPDFLLIAVVCVGIMRGPRSGCICGFCAGLLYDLISTGPFGSMMMTLVIVGYVVGYFARGILIESFGMTVAVFAVATLFAELVDAVVLTIAGAEASLGQAILLRALPSTVYDAVFAVLAFVLIKHFMEPAAARLSGNTQLK